MSGLDLQQKLAERGSDLPIVFITGHGDVPIAVRAMRSGAIDFLQKPFSDQDLLDRVHQALEKQSEQRLELESKIAITDRIGALTPREQQVLKLVVKGHPNKVIANRLGMSQRTVEVHRASIMRKMEAESLAQLVRMVVSVES
jgi:RNA polymerase sigma factor (sigma-70 family)